MLERRDRDEADRSDERRRPDSSRRKLYTRPNLTVYGRLPELTNGYGGSKPEGGNTYYT